MTTSQMILCLGPHRSGTSAVTAAIASLGADLGFSSVYANDENAKGFFEHPDLISLNERILAQLGGAWDAPAFVGRKAIAAEGRDLDPLRAEAAAFLRRSFGASASAVLKDPRLCLLLEFWLPVIAEAGFGRIDMVHVLRPPAEAALSQQARVLKRPDYYEIGRTLPEGGALWLSYMGQMWDGFGHGRHLVQSYDDLMLRPEDSLTRLGDFLGLTPDPAATARFSRHFLDPKLRSAAPDAAVVDALDAALPAALQVLNCVQTLIDVAEVRAQDIAPIDDLVRGAMPAIDVIQRAALSRLSVARRQAGADLARLRDILHEAERTSADLRAEAERGQAAILDLIVQRDAQLKERARVEADLQGALDETRNSYAAQVAALETAISELITQRDANAAETARVEADLQGALDATTNSYAAQLASLQSAIDDLIVQRDANAAETLRVAADLQALHHTAAAAYDARIEAYLAQITAQQAAVNDLVAQQGALLADRARVEADLRAVLSDMTAQRDAQAELVAESAARLAAFETQLAGLEAQRAHDQLIFERDLDLLRAAEAATRAEIDALRASHSWRLTAPVRALGTVARSGARRVANGWIRFNHFARRSYLGMSKRSPRLAEGLRRAVVPVIRAGNRAILQTDYVPMVPTHTGFVPGQTEFQFDYQRPQIMPQFRPLVSILVPNYNHAPYLRQRLDSIFAQTWDNYEVLLMDDCSSDDSRTILQDYAERYPDRARVIFNEVNSGGAFYQWEKGLRAARGDVIWVAESDDWCSPNFLETLVPFFANPAVQLAYAPTCFMNQDGSQQVWSMAEYLSDLGPDRWAAPFVMTAPQIVRAGFAEKNIIPNVSSAVFRRLDRLEVLENEIWRGMRTCGDWVFYLNQIRGGLIAYSPDAQNYYRLHPTNTSVTSFSKDSYYIEHETVAKTVQRHYSVDMSVFHRQHQNLILHWTRNRPSFVRSEFDACYALPRIAEEAAKRKPKLLMAGYAFCSGGGETFPITLANVMKTAGYDVTYLNCKQEPDIPGIAVQLARDIPIVTNFEDLNGILRDFEIDLIHSHHAWVDNTILDIVPEDSPIKTVITLHGMYETLPDEQLKRTLPRLVKRTAAMVYIAEKNISALSTQGLARPALLSRIDNALARGPVTPVPRASLGIPEDAFVLTVVSRAIAPKGWQEAIEAVTRARGISGKDVHLILVGDGPEYDRLVGQVPPFVHMTGFRSNTRDYFAAADVGLLPSRFKGESFPLVIIDCLHAGRPVIASDLGEVSTMLTTRSGIAGALFSLDEWQVPIEALASQIADLASNRALLVAMEARVPAASARFDPDLMRDRYDIVYQRACGAEADRQAAE